MKFPEFTEFEKHNGNYAVREMCKKAQRGAAQPGLSVYEYQASNNLRILPTSCRYAIKWGDGEWQTGLLKEELEFILVRFANDLDREEIENNREDENHD